MVKVTLNGTILAESTDTVVVEGNHYFPPSAIKKEYFKDSDTQYALFLSPLCRGRELTSAMGCV